MADSFTDKVKVVIDPLIGRSDRKPAGADFRSKFLAAGWTDDPGTGKAVLDEHGREIFNPVPMDPPVGFVQEPSMMDLIQRQINKHLELLRGDEEIDSEEEANDFDAGPEEFDPFSLYEFTDMIPESPALPSQEPSSLPQAEPAALAPQPAEPTKSA